ncbi:MAG: fumarylacetoacetate hydrolase family protein, partial [Bacteroidota bacterium]
LKPDTALLKDNAPFYLPDFSQEVHHELEMTIKISREGKFIEEAFAHKYYDEVGLGIDFTARDLQAKLKQNSHPWDLAKGFNGAAPVSHFLPKTNFSDLQQLNFRLEVNEVVRQQGNTQLMIHKIEGIIAYVSRFFTLKKGDILFTGTPAGVAAVKAGDRLAAYLEEEKMLDFEVK